MRLCVAIAAFVASAGGCFSPRPPAGAPCDPATGYCPTGQFCVAENKGYFCDTQVPIDGPPADAPPDAPPDARTMFAYTATVAECVDPAAPNPDTCKMIKGQDQLVVDLLDATTMQPWDVFIRFDLDSAFGMATVQKLTLELTVTDDNLAPSGNSGVVWQVAPFTKMDLYTKEPAKIGMMPISGSQGAITKLEVVHFPLPAMLAAPNGSVYLGMTTPSQDGANYWNLAGPNPPRLLVEITP